MTSDAPAAPGREWDTPTTGQLFRRGFMAMMPLWAGAIPFGIAYSIAAQSAGMPAIVVQLMSLTVFSAAAQISAVSLLHAGATTLEILMTAGALNVHLLLIGAAVARELRLPLVSRLGTAWLLTDAGYAIASSLGPLRTPVLLGAGTSMYLGWNLGTAIGLIAGQAIPDPQRFALDIVVPLTFLAVLVPMVRARPSLVVAIGAAAGTLMLAHWIPVGFAILVAGIVASLVGAWLTRPERIPGKERVP